MFLIGLISLGLAGDAAAGPATLPAGFVDTQLAGALDSPVSLAALPGPGTPRILFVEQKTARVRIFVGASVSTVGTVPDVSTAHYERGLLGVAVDPNFPIAPYVYVHATDARAGGRIAISRFTLTGDLGFSGSGTVTFDPASRYDLLVDLPDQNEYHNGGTVRFGPDGMLYASLGDDGSFCSAQNVDVPAGKILRLDTSGLPAGPGGPAPWALLTPADNPYAGNADSSARLVWVLGLRNPFRFHIDALNGDLFVADVGEALWEELSRFVGGSNGGWPWREGPAPYASCGGTPAVFTEPIAVYDHSAGAAIMSAGVYRGPSQNSVRFPAEYDGNVFYLDYFTGFMRRLTGASTNWSTPAAVAGQPSAMDWATGMNQVADVVILSDGSLVFVRQSVGYAPLSGEIRRITYPQTADIPRLSGPVAFAPPQPTPSRGAATLSWSQPVESPVRLTVLDVTGRLVRSLEAGSVLAAGTHQRVWDGRNTEGASVFAGVYFAHLETAGESRTVRIMQLR
jgi:glucose/arabinose dehydrogenase